MKNRQDYVAVLVREIKRFDTEAEAKSFRNRFGKKAEEIVIIKVKEPIRGRAS